MLKEATHSGVLVSEQYARPRGGKKKGGKPSEEVPFVYAPTTSTIFVPTIFECTVEYLTILLYTPPYHPVVTFPLR